jgi:RHS repeat-associated protein
VQDLALGYDANDHVGTIIDGLNPGRSQAFAYDELWRLEQAAGAYGTIDYAYDAAGNRLSRAITAGGTTVETYGYDAFSHRLLSVDGSTTRSFGYAADGSVVSDDRGTDVFGFAYDAAGRLTAVDKNSAPEASYAYDAFGLRVVKDLTLGGTTHANYDPDGRLLAESAATGVADREYIWLPLDFAGAGDQAWALPIALVTDAGTAGPRIHYLHTDQLGTPVAMTSGGLGQLEWSAVLRPFGEVETITGTESLALRLPGQVFDPETGFHQNWHRDYDPRLGRYLQSDPIGLEGGLNTYGYAGGNPVNLIDPSGMFAGAVPAIVACLLDPPCAALAIGAAYTAVEACKVSWDRFLNEDSGNPEAENVEEPERTPTTHPEDFENVRGSKAKRSKDTGEIWEKDMLHGDHYEVYKNRRDYERGRRDRSVWDDGRPKQRYRR